MDVLKCMSDVNTQTLSTTTRQQLIDSCQRLLRQAQASAELGTALAVELPEFTGFGKQALIRLGTLIQAHKREKAGVLQGSDPLTLVIIGLSLSRRKLDRMGATDVAEIVSQATSLGQRSRARFLEDTNIHKVVREHGSDAFIQSYHRLVAEDVFSRTLLSIEVQLEGHMKCIPYTIPHGIQFCSLTAFAISGTVTAYVPIDPVDCYVRFTTLFNESLLQSLFGYQLGR
ncbi:hypothetical protein CEP52_014757 [Fusarium oligoseptatum]|uniref:Uncharacterized protein n=1 Tax=Fusarium oligoseptatum TaxID=2604345 RepID=A0A428SJ71_9HYPO|nr:hypothetical protein CEP52_014757 [Fusarium oligoseptatum]